MFDSPDKPSVGFKLRRMSNGDEKQRKIQHRISENT
jgi:hypothetical protein